MGKKKGGSGSGENEKVVAARDRKAAQKDEKNSRQAKQAEDAFWEGAGEGAKSKAQKKKEEADARAAEAAKKKREAKLLAEAEEQALARAGKKDKSEPKVKPEYYVNFASVEFVAFEVLILFSTT
jgi:hypothetical protein